MTMGLTPAKFNVESKRLCSITTQLIVAILADQDVFYSGK